MLHVEQLESRLTPSSVSFVNGVLSVKADASTPVVLALDDGHNDVTLIGLGAGGANGGAVLLGSFAGVQSEGWTFGGPDTVYYLYTGAISNGGSQFSHGESLDFQLIPGASVSVSAPSGIAAGEVWIEGQGTGAFNVSFGGVAANARADLLVLSSGAGTMTASVNVSGAVVGVANVYVENINATSVNLTATYSGVVAGSVQVQAYDYHPSALSSYSVTLDAQPGSTGYVQGYEVAQLGNLSMSATGDDAGFVEGYIITTAANAGNVHAAGDVEVYAS